MAGALLTRYRQMSRHGVRRAARLHQYIPLMLLAHVLLAGSFVWIYTRGREPGKPWMGQGVRFGIAVALLTVVPTYMIYFVVQPTPAELALKQGLFDGVLLILLGIIAAWWFRERAG